MRVKQSTELSNSLDVFWDANVKETESEHCRDYPRGQVLTAAPCREYSAKSPRTAEHLALSLYFVSHFIIKRRYFFPALGEERRGWGQRRTEANRTLFDWAGVSMRRTQRGNHAPVWVFWLKTHGLCYYVGTVSGHPSSETQLCTTWAVNLNCSYRPCNSVVVTAGITDMVPRPSSSHAVWELLPERWQQPPSLQPVHPNYADETLRKLCSLCLMCSWKKWWSSK